MTGTSLRGARVLVLAPHTDDGELGAGGLLSRAASEAEDVLYVAFSDCRQSLPEGFAADTLHHECAAAMSALGLPPPRIADFQVRRFAERRQDILDYMIDLRKEFRPSLVLAPASSDTHQDHAVIHGEATRAFRTCNRLGYDLPWNCRSFSYDLFIPLEPRHLQAKIASMACYESQAGRVYASADAITATATYHGLKAGCRLAEAFEVSHWALT